MVRGTEILMFLARDRPPPHPCQKFKRFIVCRSTLFSDTVKSCSPVEAVRKYFSLLGLESLLPSEIQNLTLFIEGLARLMHVLPESCERVFLHLTASTTRIRRCEVAIDDQETVDSLFRDFVARQGHALPSVTSHVNRQLTIEPAEIVEISKELLDYDGAAGGKKGCCAVCLNGILVGDKAYRTPCLHVYHSECLSRWLDTAASCPVCRFDLSHNQAWTFSGLRRQRGVGIGLIKQSSHAFKNS